MDKRIIYMSFKDFSSSRGPMGKDKAVEKTATPSTVDQKNTVTGKEMPVADVAKP